MEEAVSGFPIGLQIKVPVKLQLRPSVDNSWTCAGMQNIAPWPTVLSPVTYCCCDKTDSSVAGRWQKVNKSVLWLVHVTYGTIGMNTNYGYNIQTYSHSLHLKHV